jgi:hypothetical protein
LDESALILGSSPAEVNVWLKITPDIPCRNIEVFRICFLLIFPHEKAPIALPGAGVFGFGICPAAPSSPPSSSPNAF